MTEELLSPIPPSAEEAEKSEELLKAILGTAVLAKACQDEFSYAMKLRTGEVILFSGATVLNREWVNLNIGHPTVREDGLPFTSERGIDVRLADIVWVMDNPEL
jgi:hypothetical protein